MYSDDVLQADEAARQRILMDLDTTFLVEAGAGSGKTTSIVGRMLSLVRSGKAEAREIAAITFTNKAASELMGRFRMKLEQELAIATAGDERDRLAQALEQLPECFIGTIHAFCGRLLRERPIEAGVDPAFTEMEEQEEKLLRHRSWDLYLEALRAEGRDQSIEELARLQVSVEDLREVYERVCEYEDVCIATEETERPLFDTLRDTLLPLLEEAVRWIPTVQPEKDWDDLQKTVRTAVRHVAAKDMTDDLSMLAVAKLFDRSLNVTQNRWTDPKLGKQLKEQFHDWQTEVLRPFLERWRQHLHPQLIGFVLPALEFGRQQRVAAGRLSFQDLLMKATELLRRFPEVRSYFARRYTRLFVDEFQDTDPIQAEMMLLLTGADLTHANWREQLPRPGSLFVVGDPKQTIYRFRRADISTYNLVKKRIAASGDVLQLTRNFRSVKSIGDYVNYAFESKFTMPGQSSEQQAPYVRMLTQLPSPKGKASLHGVYTMTVPKQERDRQADIAWYDAQRMAQFIAWACAGNMTIQEKALAGAPASGVGTLAASGSVSVPASAAALASASGAPSATVRPARPGDFMILHPYRKFIQLYAEALERYGIASDTSGGKGVFPELRALVQLASALADYTDQVPLLAVLTGSLFGLSEDELYHYRSEGGRIHLYSAVDEAALSAKGARVQRALDQLRLYAGWTRTLSPLAALTRIIDELGLVPWAAVSEAGALRSGTLLKLLEALQADAGSAVSWQSLTERLRNWAEESSLEPASLYAGSGDAVRIMNLHKAKGLEAPVVLLACPCGYTDHDAEEHIDRSTDPALGYFVIKKQRDTFTKEIVAQPVGWTERAEKERTFMHAEADRLLYVAVTRAKQLLIVSQYPSKPAIDPWSSLASSLEKQPELELTPMPPVQAEELAPDEAPSELDRAEALAAALQRGGAPSYRTASVTALAKAGRQAVGRDAAAVAVEVIDAVDGDTASVDAAAADVVGVDASAAIDGAIAADNGVAESRAAAGSAIVDPLPGRSAGGKGMAYGTLVHRCLQALGEGLSPDELPDFCRMAAEEEEVEEKWLALAEQAVRLVAESELWQRMKRARNAYHEFSFITSTDGVEGYGLEQAQLLLLRGVIDLVFEEEDGGWVIVDFKTDRHEIEQEGTLVQHYKSQVVAYANEWERLTGGRVKETGLYFMDTNRYVQV
ncbi:exodeoxyribonuclease V subunit beta [Paenibacillus sp. YYML68]|uniref:UvrD-helicase domain-containing protein n=1 Tax=Paenibacillus sp. YYML68 TaxID=2909250 RepID=UPI00249348EC|nr:UvrD-helicase domain-containing protein [Paenibacillus sp. YYML68]